jgi:CDP-glucose 4,6-dehydratase
VIGGGDWGIDRLIPDLVRAVIENNTLLVRNPLAVRPWQHVLEPLSGYLLLAEHLWQRPEEFSESWNFGPDEQGTVSVATILDSVREIWGAEMRWRVDDISHPEEARYLRLDCTKARTKLGWKPLWNLHSALEATVQWYKAYQTRQELREMAESQILSYQTPGSERTRMPFLRGSSPTDLCGFRNVAALELLSPARATQTNGAVLPTSCSRMQPVLSCAA